MAIPMIRSDAETSNDYLISQQFALAFHDMHKDAKKNQKLVDIARGHYAKRLNASELCSAIRRRLNPETSLNQRVKAGRIINTFSLDLSHTVTDHVVVESVLKTLIGSFSEQLCHITMLKNACAVFFVGATVVCAVTATSAASVVVGALGGWCSFVLNKRETALKNLIKTAEIMIRGSKFAIEHIGTIRALVEWLKVETGTIADEVKAETVEMRVGEFQEKIEAYNSEMKWVKEQVLETIF